MKKNGLVLIAVLLVTGICCIIFFFTKEKTAYVDVKKIYEEFEMKKELSDKIAKVQNERNKILDSLEIELKILSQKISIKKTDQDVAVFNVKRENFFNLKQQFTEDNQATIADYDAKILKQLNQYIEDYGKANRYTYILGYSGNGELLYGDRQKDITSSLSDYINEKYKGVQ